MTKSYDVFLSHNSADKAAVELIAHRLREEVGLNPFLDKWHLVPGESWQVALEDALEASETVAVFVGPSGVSPWHNEELRTALNQAVRTRDEYRVIPVLLPEANPEDVSAFLAQRTWVDFRSGLDGNEAFDRLVAGIKGQAITSGAYKLPDEPAPYRGLLRFEVDQAEFFFGREEDTKQLLDRVSQSSFVAVIGASGSGKSSLVRAGLFPALADGEILGSEKWRCIILTPGSYPVRALANQLATLQEGSDRLKLADQLEERLLGGPDGLRTTISTLLAESQGETGSVLLVIDQFEELFTLCLDTSQQRCNDQAQAFIQNIADAVVGGDQQIRVVITLRADFLNHCLAFPALKNLLQDKELLLGPLDQSVLRDVIVRPAQKVGAFFENGLVRTILRDIEDNPGSLPLLQHALYELWRARQGPWLTLDAYEESGGVSGALHRRAQTTYDSLTAEQQIIARNIFLRLTALGEGVSDTRRRVDLEELYISGADQNQVDDVLQKLSGSNARLIVTSETEVEVAHEALIQGWGTLRNWLDTNREGLRIHRILTQDAEEWDRDLNRDEGALYRGARLAQALEWAETNSGDLNPLENEFLMASQEHQVNELEEAKRQTNRLRQRAIYLTGALVIAIIAAFFAFQQMQRAENATEQALADKAAAEAAEALADDRRIEAEQQTRQAFANSLAAQALGYYETFPQQSLLLAVEGGRVISENEESEPASLRFFLFRALRELSGSALIGHHDIVWSIDFSPDSHWLATSSRDGILQLWDLTGLVENEDATRDPYQIDSLDGEIFTVTFSPDNRWLAASGGDHHIWVWDMTDGVSLDDPILLEGHQGIVDFLEFNPLNGDQLVSGSRDNTARIWDLSQADPSESAQILNSQDSDISALRFSSDGSWLATGSADSVVRLWDLSAGDVFDRVILLTGHEGTITDLAFSPNADWLASASVDKTARLWDLSSPQEGVNSVKLPGHKGEIRALTFSKDGQNLFTGSLDRTIRAWNLTSPDPAFRPVIMQGHKESVITMTLGPKGEWLITGSNDGDVGLWNLDEFTGTVDPIFLRGHEGSIRTIAFSPDGRWLGTGSADQSVRLWDLKSPNSATFPISLKGHEKAIQAVDISPNGGWVATGSNDNQVRLWRLNSSDPNEDPVVLSGHSGNILAATFSPDGKWLATGGNDDTIRLWDITSNPITGTHVLSGHEDSVDKIFFSLDQKWLVSGSRDSTVRLWDFDSQNPDQFAVVNHLEISTISVTPNCPWLVVGSGDGSVHIFDLKSSHPTDDPTVLKGHEDAVTSIDISYDCNRLVTGSADTTLRLWDLSAEDPSLSPTLLEGHTNPVALVAFDSQNRWLASAASDEKYAILWDLQDANPAENSIILNGHEKEIIRFDVTPNGRWLITGSSDFTLRLWDMNSIDPSINSLVLPGINILKGLESDDNWVVIGSQDRTARVWPLNLARLYNMACVLAGRNLTQAEWNQYFSNQPYNQTCSQWPAGN